jgi:DNA-directed RNA polymerase II subunit RPB1
MDTNTYNNDVDSISAILRIEFTLLGNELIKKISALGEESNGIEIVDLYDNSEPRRGSLNDPRGGTSGGHDVICATCGLDVDCPGHSMHINLAEYVFHIGYLLYVQKILSCICFNCSKLLINKNEDELKEILKKPPHERLPYVKNATKNVNFCLKSNCGCGAQKPKIRTDIKKGSGAINMVAEMELKNDGEKTEATGEFIKTKASLLLNAEMVYEIFKKISDDDCRILGLDPEKSRPEDLIHKVLYVPPVQVRPSIRGDFGSGMGSEDDLTHKLGDIVRNNIKIIKNKENQTANSSKYHSDYAHLLQYHVATYMDNEGVAMLKAIEHKGRPIKCVASRLKGKQGRIRGNLMGNKAGWVSL